MNTDHVVMNAKTNEFECLHCGSTYKPTMPAPVSLFVKMTREFSRIHKHCKRSIVIEKTEGEKA
jgi:hypothetical protein